MTDVVRPGTRVVLRYRVLAGPKIVDRAEKPIEIVVGKGDFLPVVEKALIGHQPGDHLSVLVPPDKLYGPYDPKKLSFIPIERLPKDLHPGQVIQIQDEYGIPHPATVRRLDQDIALVDYNHPLAGRPLRFEIEILGVKPPDPNINTAFDTYDQAKASNKKTNSLDKEELL